MGVPSGPASRAIEAVGQRVTLATETVTVDHTSDWDDETYDETVDEVTAIVETPGGRADAERNEAGRDFEVDKVVHVPGGTDHPFSDGAGDTTPTEVTVGHETYATVQWQRRGNGTVRLEVTRT